MVSLEYFAGFIDGEGYLALARIKRRHGSLEYCVRVCVYNTDSRVLAEIRHGWGGFLSAVGQRRPTWKPSYALIWTNAAAVKLLEKVAPHLRVKSEQATALLEFNEHVRAGRRIRDSAGHLLPLTEGDLGVRATFHERLRRLNMKGESVRPDAPVHSSPNPTHLSAAYLAGFIDAEGCLMIPKSTQANGRSHYRARISIGNTDKPVLEDIRAQFGGIMTNQSPEKIGWSYSYQLIWSDGMVESILAAVMPYLVGKRRQATIMLDLVHHKKSTLQGRNARGFARHPETVAAFRENLRRQMKELNAKGPSVPVGLHNQTVPAVSSS